MGGTPPAGLSSHRRPPASIPAILGAGLRVSGWRFGWQVAFSCYRKSRLLSSLHREFPAAAEAGNPTRSLAQGSSRLPGDARLVLGERGPLCPRAKAEDLARSRLGPTLTRARLTPCFRPGRPGPKDSARSSAGGSGASADGSARPCTRGRGLRAPPTAKPRPSPPSGPCGPSALWPPSRRLQCEAHAGWGWRASVADSISTKKANFHSRCWE